MKEMFVYAPPQEVEVSRQGLTIGEIAKKQGKTWASIVLRLAPLKEQLDLPESLANLRELRVPLEVCRQLSFVNRTEIPAEEWLSANAIAEKLDVAQSWVARRILFIKQVGEFRVTNGRSCLHLPPEALNELAEVRKREAVRIDPNEYLNLDQLAKSVGRTRVWVTNRLNTYDTESIVGLDKSGKAVMFYPRSVLGFLLEEKQKFPASNGWLSLPKLAKAIGKDQDWVVNRLVEMGEKGEHRCYGKSGRVYLYFRPEILNALQEKASLYVEAEEGWATAHALAIKIGKSEGWVARKLRLISAEPRLMEDVHGRLMKHYPPETETELSKLAIHWRLRGIIRGPEEDEQEDTAGRFGDIYARAERVRTLDSFIKLGVLQEELDYWEGLGLISRSNGHCTYTSKGRLSARRIRVADKIVKRMEKAALVLEGDWQES